MPRATQQVWLLVLPNTGLLNIANPWEVLAHTNDVLGRTAYELSLYGPRGPAVRTGHGITIQGLTPLPRAPRRLPDIAIVAGSPRIHPDQALQSELSRWLRKQHRRIPHLLSICTGAFVLAEAGVLDGRRATTHWQWLNALRQGFPKVNVVDDGIFVRDGRVWTSAGLTAGVDLMLALVESQQGHEVAIAVAKRMVLYLRRSGKQAQFSSALARQAKEPARLSDLDGFVLEHLDESLPVSRLARGLGMSVRTLSRWCRKHLDESPAEVVQRLRIEAAQRLLEDSSLPLKAVAARTGLGDPSTLFRVFSLRFGVTPAAYRERFART
ncbi:MAG TPA: GlxA family transcriptional regulator [Polyangiaceae bacterium]|jgi:transcriptional regulator GlxA family with amidase domain|nr:GlxA family transcriptional regulator [Polyangiaceae bacterium]